MINMGKLIINLSKRNTNMEIILSSLKVDTNREMICDVEKPDLKSPSKRDVGRRI